MLGVESAQSVEIFGAKDRAESLDGKEERGVGGLPAVALVSERASRDQGMEVNMGLQALIPGMEDHNGAQLAIQAALPELQQRLTGAAKKQAEQKPFVGQHQGVELVRQGPNGVQVRGRQELCSPGLDPSHFGHRLTFGTMSIATGVVGLTRKAARRAVLGVPA